MKECELCDVPARMYCESDQASLCFDCDAKVHGANFLVARHSRNLLCQACQSPTPWKASGPRLAPTVSLCDRCVSRCDGRRSERQGEEEEQEEGEGGNEIDDDEEDDDDDDDDDDDGDEDGDDGVGGGDEEEDGENQVVPWSSTAPPVPSSSSSDDSSIRFGGAAADMAAMAFSLKRMRENADLGSQDDLTCSSSHEHYDAVHAAAAENSAEDEATSFWASSMDRKKKKAVFLNSARAVESRSALIGCSLKIFEEAKSVFGEDELLDICKLREEDPRAVDFASSSISSSPGRRMTPI